MPFMDVITSPLFHYDVDAAPLMLALRAASGFRHAGIFAARATFSPMPPRCEFARAIYHVLIAYRHDAAPMPL